MNNKKLGSTWNRGQALVWLVSVLPIILSAAVYQKLPQRIPTNWGFDGQISYGPKSTLWALAGIAPFLAVLFQVLPYIDPKKRNYLKFRNVYQSFQLFFQLFMLVMVGIVITESFRPGTIQVATLVTAMCGILFMFIGNIMPKFRQNFFCGFRTPWALSDETVWNKTHRLAGRLMFGAGLLGFGGAFLPWDRAKMAFLLVPLMAATIIPYVMSYVWFRNLSKDNPLSR
ncbi:MAG: DUF1648 domain-containing protein [Hungatella sp.]|nr:DUF1648 domain-containing protein [Hungatella sp.]